MTISKREMRRQFESNILSFWDYFFLRVMQVNYNLMANIRPTS